MAIRSQASFDTSMALVRANYQGQFEKPTSFLYLLLEVKVDNSTFAETLFVVSIFANYWRYY